VPNTGYTYDENDGKIHSRFSELLMMTPGQVDRAMEVRLGEREPFESESMKFGTLRHEYFEQETARTGKLPRCFYEIAGLKDVVVDRTEREFALELAPGFIVHSRPDAYSVSDKTIYDYKTTVDGVRGWQQNVKQYRSSKQIVFYAMMLHYHGIEITRARYLCEIWDSAYENIIGYDMVEREITPDMIAEVRSWALDRLSLLWVALEEAVLEREEAKKAFEKEEVYIYG
jgi:hypothetical protein